MSEKLFTKNFSLLVFGQASSLLGNLLLRFALSMFVLEETGSATIFAGILAAATIPTILLSPLGGILSDRVNRRNLMVLLDALTGCSILVATRFLNQTNSISIIATLLVVLSVLGAFETPTVQACVPQMQTGDNIVRGNAVVNQVAAVLSMVAPILGSVLYVALGLRSIMATSVLFFFLTALSECFIRLPAQPKGEHTGVLFIVKKDFTQSIHFIHREQPGILKMLLLTALVGFFVMGTVMVGLPYLVRNILGLTAAHYGAAESAIGIAAILGSIAAGLLIGKLPIRRLSQVLAALGICLLPTGAVFLLPVGTTVKFLMVILGFCGMQIASIVFSIFAVSLIQQRTPNHLIGKVMAYTATITLSAQPLGQALYGVLFDLFRDRIYWVLLPTGLIIAAIGLLSTPFFSSLGVEETLQTEGNNRL